MEVNSHQTVMRFKSWIREMEIKPMGGSRMKVKEIRFLNAWNQLG